MSALFAHSRRIRIVGFSSQSNKAVTKISGKKW
jgi:hypothetical protein